MEEGRNAFKVIAGKPRRKRLLGRPKVDGRTILEWILKKELSVGGLALIWFWIGIIGELL